jgi:hypothetical protein
MYRNLLMTMSAAALSLGLLAAGPALAQVQLAEEVEAKLTMLGIDTTMIVTEEQLLEIEGVLNGTDTDDTKTEAINVILAQ